MSERAQVTRRNVLQAGAIAGAGLLATPALAGEPSRPKPLRVAHLTDMHVQPERRAAEGYLAALESLSRHDPPVDLIVTGGDHVMDATAQTLDRAKVQWDVYDRIIAQTKLPVRPVLGNHDIFGWGTPQVSQDTVGYGRAMALDRLKMDRAYYSFDAGGWKFIVLDSITRRGSTYLGELGPQQAEWLKGELSSAGGRPVIVFSHIPILSVCVFFDGAERLGAEAWNVPDSWMHRDARALVELLSRHKVKVAASGHIHLVDRADYRSITFLCNGAVSGNWWKGPCQQFPEGYALLDLWADGSFEHRYVSYGWKAQPG
jgi:3',5'-cyclic AMP phosphodiesterase CpdA